MSSTSLGVNVAVTGRLPKRIVIVGNNESAWMAAACLSIQIRHLGCRITVVSNGPPTEEFVGESSSPSLLGLLSNLRIDEHEMMRQTQGTYRLATQFSDWVQNERDFWMPVAPLDARLDTASIFPLWLSERTQGRLLRPLHSYSLHWGAALAGKAPYSFSGPSQISRTGAYSFHLDGRRFAEWLRQIAMANETEEIVSEIATINKNGRGGIAQLKLATGTIVASDVFLDCTGSQSLLLRSTLKDEFLPCEDRLICDRTVVLRLPGRRQVPPFTRITGLDAGYAWQFPLAGTVIAGYSFSSRLADDETAIEQLKKLLVLDGFLSSDTQCDSQRLMPEFRSRKLGRQTNFWRDNVVAIGTSAGTLEPLISASRQLTQLAIESFIELFPERQASHSTVGYFNERLTTAFDELQDFAQLHYLVSKRTDTLFWQAMKKPGSIALEQKLNLYAASGACGQLAPEAVGQSSYWSLLTGCGRLPATPSLTARAADPAQIQQNLRDILKSNEAALKDLPLHEELLDWIHMDGRMLKSA